MGGIAVADREAKVLAAEYRAQVGGDVGILSVSREIARGHEEWHIVGVGQKDGEGQLDRDAYRDRGPKVSDRPAVGAHGLDLHLSAALEERQRRDEGEGDSVDEQKEGGEVRG